MSANGFLIKGISSISDISLLRAQGSGMIGIAGIASRLFGALAKQNINVILITQASSEHSICFAVNPKEAARAKQAIDQEFALEMQAGQMDKAAVEENLSIVAAVGENMKQSPGVAGKVFQALGASGVNVVAIAQGSSELNISAVIYKEDESRALNVLHDSFFISAMKPLNIFLAGTGLIGGTLLKQIRRQAPILKQESGLDINLAALADIDRMIFNSNGVFADWKKDPGGEKTDLPLFIKKMKEAALPNSVFVDCTASEAVADFYEEILSAGISIATPNKKANSGQYEKYARLKNAAKKRGVKFLYETNVGAGLPVISVLNNLVKSGDKILKIEAVLSGTLSFIFNSFRGDKKFSEAVREAKESGYTEPDPRDDLSGLDAARKILILAREAGFSLEMKDIEIQDIIPPGCKNAKDVNDFFSELEKEDGYFEELKRKAENSGKVLRCIARLENGKAGIFLEEVDFSHPFYSLSGSDNIISFTTEYYKNAPLVVKGPGAGAEVTAAGVFADILSV
jgi:bifunctional aspartokinase / homoserine dehydrogenase 1